MSYKMQTQTVTSSENTYSKNPADYFYEELDQSAADEEMHFPPLPDLIDVEDPGDELDSDQMYVRQLLADHDSIQLGD